MGMLTAQELTGGKPPEPEKPVAQEPPAEPPEPPEPPAKNPTLAKKHGFIDFAELDPKTRSVVEPRMNSLYRGIKEAEESIASLRREKETLARQLRERDSKEQQKQVEGEVGRIEADIETALKKADYKRAARLTVELNAAQQKAAAPPKQEASEGKTFDEGELQQLWDWRSEITEDGRVTRPWAHKGHPLYQGTTKLLNDLNARYPDWPMSRILAAADQAVQEHLAGRQQQKSPQQQQGRGEFVATSDAAPPRRNDKEVALTERQKDIARKQFPKDPKAFEKYRDGLRLAGRL